jgi:predicted dehydrogenase
MQTRFLVVGCGSIGNRHIKNLLDLKQYVIAFEPDENTRQNIKSQYAIQVFNDLDKAIDLVDAVLICSPSYLHAEHIEKCIYANKHIFVEKPLACSLNQLTNVKSLMKDFNKVFQVGFNWRFHKQVLKLQDKLDLGRIGKIYNVQLTYSSYLPNWRKNDYTETYSANKNMGGGIILDNIHDIDIARKLFGNIISVYCSARRIGDLDIDVEDTADIILEMNNFNVYLHMDYLGKIPLRSCKIIGDEMCDILYNDIELTMSYIAEIKHFIALINGSSAQNISTFDDGYESLKIAEYAKQSANAGKMIYI